MIKPPETSISAEKEKSNGGPKLYQMDEMDSISVIQNDKVPLQYYMDLILSSKRVISMFVIASVGIAFLMSKLISPTYLATTTIMVSKANVQQSSNYDTVMISENLARTYTEMIISGNVLDQVSSLLNSSVSSRELRTAIAANHISDTQLIEIGVEYSDPELAVKIANSLVEVLSSQIKQGQLASAANQDNGIKTLLQETESEIVRLQEKIREQSIQLHNQRLDTINLTIKDLRSQIEQINKEIAPLLAKPTLTVTEQFELSNMETRKGELSALLLQYQNELASLTITGPTFDSRDFASSQDYALLDQYQRTYRNLIDIHQNLEIARMQNTVAVTQVDQPVLPESPIRPNLMFNLVLGLAAGLLLAAIYIFITKLGKL